MRKGKGSARVKKKGIGRVNKRVAGGFGQDGVWVFVVVAQLVLVRPTVGEDQQRRVAAEAHASDAEPANRCREVQRQNIRKVAGKEGRSTLGEHSAGKCGTRGSGRLRRARV